MDNGLRQIAHEAAVEALRNEPWGGNYEAATHGVRGDKGHMYDGACAVCKGDLTRIVTVALDAADAALTKVADP